MSTFPSLNQTADSLWSFDSGRDDLEALPYGQDDDDEHVYEGGKDCCIYLIDASSMMEADHDLKLDDDDELPEGFEIDGVDNSKKNCLECTFRAVRNGFRQNILTRDDYLAAVVLYGTKKSKGPEGTDASEASDNVYVVMDLDVLKRDHVLKMEDLLRDQGTDDIGLYGSNYNLMDAIWCCQNMFSKVRTKVETKRIVIFTNQDNPHGNDADLQRAIQTRGGDLRDNGIEVNTIGMDYKDHSFESERFFDQFSRTTVSAALGFESFWESIRDITHKKRARMTIPVRLADGLEFGVKVYNLYTDPIRPKHVWTHEHKHLVRPRTTLICNETTTKLLPDDLKFGAKLGGSRVVFTKDEKLKLKAFGQPGLRLMGFKPRDWLKDWHHCKKSSFLYPDESVIQGSTSLFTTLWASCFEKDKIPICRFVSRAGVAPTFCALLPQKATVSEEDPDKTIMPPGFHLIHLPFKDDLREGVPVPFGHPEPDEEAVAKAKKLIKRINAKNWSLDMFKDPVLQTHFDALEALALSRPDIKTTPNDMMPAEFPEAASRVSKEFEDLVYEEGYDPAMVVSTAKRSAASSGAAKRPKVDPDQMDEAYFMAEHKAGRLSKCTIPQLKKFAKMKGIKGLPTKKADILERIEEEL